MKTAIFYPHFELIDIQCAIFLKRFIVNRRVWEIYLINFHLGGERMKMFSVENICSSLNINVLCTGKIQRGGGSPVRGAGEGSE